MLPTLVLGCWIGSTAFALDSPAVQTEDGLRAHRFLPTGSPCRVMLPAGSGFAWKVGTVAPLPEGVRVIDPSKVLGG